MKDRYYKSITKCCILFRNFSNTTRNTLKYDENFLPHNDNYTHCYRTLFPWKNKDELSKHLASSVIYKKGGLIALNKPFGIKILCDKQPKSNSNPKHHRLIVPGISEHSIQDSLPALQEYLKVKKLSILKSAERYTSGIVLMSSTDRMTAKVKKSLNIAKFQKKPHLIHWCVTLGYSPVAFRKEKVGLKFLETKDSEVKLPVIETEFSKRACKLRKIYTVEVEARTLCVNKILSTSLAEIATSRDKYYFLRVYANSRVAPILGDTMYGSRMKPLLGIPVKVQLQNASAYNIQPVSDEICEALNLPKGENGIKIIPPMIHLRSIVLPNFEEKDKDLVITAELPSHLQWTVDKLNLLYC